MTIATFAAAFLFALIHIFIGKLRFLGGIPRSRWLSFAGGVAVAYVFLHVLPELNTHQGVLQEALRPAVADTAPFVYCVAMVGLAVFYGLERAAKSSRGRKRAETGEDRMEEGAFWLHVGSFTLYNVLIGYLLTHREEPGTWSLVIYATAMSLHFLTSDFGLRGDDRERYDRIGRWLTAAAVLAGWALGLVVEVSETAVAVLFAFLAGGVTLNVLKEELPEERESRFLPFAIGAFASAVLLLLGDVF